MSCFRTSRTGVSRHRGQGASHFDLSYGETGELLFDGKEAAIIFCNVGISVNGEFGIATENPSRDVTGCFSMNTTYDDVNIDSASACALNGGAGYPWDRWNAISIEYHGNQLW